VQRDITAAEDEEGSMSIRDFTVFGSGSQVPTRNRNHNGYLLRFDGEGLLFDPGEGTQRQFIFARVAPTVVNRIFITHFHGDHCLGLPGMLQRLSLDQIPHKLHIYYPASGEQYLANMRAISVFHDRLDIELHPVSSNGVIDETDGFRVIARELIHPVDTYGYRIEEKAPRKFIKEQLDRFGLKGPLIGELAKNGEVDINGRTVTMDDVSTEQKGFVFSFILDTEICENARLLARDASFVVTEGTFLSSQAAKAKEYGHMTVRQACTMAKDEFVEHLMLTHFSQRYQTPGPLRAEADKYFPGTFIAQDLLRVCLRSYGCEVIR
jgi:ribonuclease Z